MASAAKKKIATGRETNQLREVAELLGGTRILARRVTSALDAHELLLRGLPASALDHLIGQLVVLHKAESLEKAVGMSIRTYQRRKDSPSVPLSPEQSGRAWKFAEILSKATNVFGSQAAAEQWLDRRAIGLDQRRPIDLFATPAGVELVEDHLARLKYGVYA